MPDIFECEDANTWSLLLESSSSASAYHLWEYGEVLSQTYGYKRHYLTYASGNELNGALPLIQVKSMLLGNRLISLPFCEYGGPLIRSDLKPGEASNTLRRLLNAGVDLATKLGLKYIELRHPSISDESVLVQPRFDKVQSYVTFRIDLTKGATQLWNSLDKKTRNAVRKSQKSGLQIEYVNEPDKLREYYGLYLQTQKRLGSPPNSFKLFENLFSAFSLSKKMRMILAKHEGESIAGITVFFHGNNVFWWNNVSDMKHRSLNPTNLLLWSTIEWAVEKGYKTMDLGRTRKFSTIYDFKSGFEGEEKPLIDYVRFLTSGKKELPDPSQQRYRFVSSLWGLLPVSVTRKIGPRIIKGIAL